MLMVHQNSQKNDSLNYFILYEKEDSHLKKQDFVSLHNTLLDDAKNLWSLSKCIDSSILENSKNQKLIC